MLQYSRFGPLCYINWLPKNFAVNYEWQFVQFMCLDHATVISKPNHSTYDYITCDYLIWLLCYLIWKHLIWFRPDLVSACFGLISTNHIMSITDYFLHIVLLTECLQVPNVTHAYSATVVLIITAYTATTCTAEQKTMDKAYFSCCIILMLTVTLTVTSMKYWCKLLKCWHKHCFVLQCFSSVSCVASARQSKLTDHMLEMESMLVVKWS